MYTFYTFVHFFYTFKIQSETGKSLINQRFTGKNGLITLFTLFFLNFIYIFFIFLFISIKKCKSVNLDKNSLKTLINQAFCSYTLLYTFKIKVYRTPKKCTESVHSPLPTHFLYYHCTLFSCINT